MLRRLFKFLWVVSFVLCILAGMLWVRGNWNYDSLYLRTWNQTVWSFHCSQGRMTIEHFRDWPRPARVRYSSGQNMGPTGDYSKLRGPIQALNHFGGAHTKPWRWRQFEGSYGAICISALPDGSVDWDLPAMEKFRSITTVTWSNPMPYWQVVLPHWVIFALLAVLPSFRLALIAGGWMIRKFRRKEGCCAACGYDLRATPDRCPECGAVPAAANAKA